MFISFLELAPLPQPSQLPTTDDSFIFASSTFQFLKEVLHESVFHTFHFQFQQLIQKTSEPCHVFRLLAAYLWRALCAKKSSFSASNGPVSGR